MNHEVDNVMTRNLYVTNSILRVLVLRFWIPGRPWLQGPRYQAPESQVLILDYLVYIEHLSGW